MSLIVTDEIGFAAKTQTAFYTDSGKISMPKDAQTFSNSEWSPWGDNNDEPALIADDIENCPVLSAGVDTEARLAVGNCVDTYLLLDKDAEGKETVEWVSDSEILDFFEANQSYEYSHRNTYNSIGYGWGATQFLLNAKRDKINRILATDVYSARLQKKDANGKMNYMYLCGDWQSAPSVFNADKMKRVSLLQEGWELDQLQQTSSGYEFAMLHRILKNGRTYYPRPMHRSAKAWVKISRSIPNIKAALHKNQMIIKYLVTISETYWLRIHKKWSSLKAEEKELIIQAKYQSINDWLTGEINAGKTILAGNYYDPIAQEYVPDIKIDVIDDKMKDGKMLPDNAAADKQILFSMFFNPAIWGGNLLGDGASGGAGSGSDIREATLVLLNLLNPERQNNLKIFNLVKNYNGWSKRLEIERDVFAITDAPQNNQRARKIKPRLVFRYSSAVLTTLDKGGSQKPVTN